MTNKEPIELPVFEFEGGRKMYPPYIQNCAQEFEQKISMGDPEVLGETMRFNLMQAYYAGFSRACSFVDMLHTDPQPVIQEGKTLVLDAIKEELKAFSKASRELGAKLGLGHVSVKNG